MTLAGMLLIRGVPQTTVQGGTPSLGTSPLLGLANGELFMHGGDLLVPYPLLIFAGVIVLASYVLHSSVMGRLRDHEGHLAARRRCQHNMRI